MYIKSNIGNYVMEGDYNLWADLASAGTLLWDTYMEGWEYIFNFEEHFAPKLPLLLLYIGVHGPVLNFILNMLQEVGIGNGGPMQTKTENQRMSENVKLLADSAKWNNLSNGRAVNGWAGDARPVGTKK